MHSYPVLENIFPLRSRKVPKWASRVNAVSDNGHVHGSHIARQMNWADANDEHRSACIECGVIGVPDEVLGQARGANNALSLIYHGNRREFGWLFALFRPGQEEQIGDARQRMRSLLSSWNPRNQRNEEMNGNSLVWNEKVMAHHYRVGHLLARYRSLEKSCTQPRMTPEEVIATAGSSFEESLVRCCDVTLRGSGLVIPEVQRQIDDAVATNRTAEPLI